MPSKMHCYVNNNRCDIANQEVKSFHKYFYKIHCKCRTITIAQRLWLIVDIAYDKIIADSEG